MNVVLLVGTLSRDPEARALPSGDALLSFDLTTRWADEPADSTPVVWFEPSESASALAAGSSVVVIGRVRRRFFRSAGITQSRTEVVADRVVPSRHRRRARSAVDQAIVRVQEAPLFIDP